MLQVGVPRNQGYYSSSCVPKLLTAAEDRRHSLRLTVHSYNDPAMLTRAACGRRRCHWPWRAGIGDRWQNRQYRAEQPRAKRCVARLIANY